MCMQDGTNGGVNGDPCKGGNEMREDEAPIRYNPDGSYHGDTQCEWVIFCPTKSDTVHLTVDSLSTESQYDHVILVRNSMLARTYALSLLLFAVCARARVFACLL